VRTNGSSGDGEVVRLQPVLTGVTAKPGAGTTSRPAGEACRKVLDELASATSWIGGSSGILSAGGGSSVTYALGSDVRALFRAWEQPRAARVLPLPAEQRSELFGYQRWDRHRAEAGPRRYRFGHLRCGTGTRSSAIQGDGKGWPEPAHSRLSVEDRFCGAPVARITVIR
jgi:hypothetical protein